jgi:hypothetical protein
VQEYWTPQTQRDHNLHLARNANTLAPEAPQAATRQSPPAPSVVSPSQAVGAAQTAPFVSEKWMTLKVEPGQVEEAKAKGVHEYPNNYKPGEMRYTVPPGTDLTTVQEYWTPQTQRDHNLHLAKNANTLALEKRERVGTR